MSNDEGNAYAGEIRLFIQKAVGPEISVLADENIFERGLVTSQFSLQLVLFLEKKFEISVELADLDRANFASINAICRFLAKKRNPSLVPA
jgi:acyl carrier protein